MIPFSLHDFPKPGATDFCAKHQALPLQGRCCSMTSWFHLVDFQCCGKGLRTDNDGKTISSLRLYNAICIKNIDFRSTTKHLNPRSRVEVSVNESLTCLDVCGWSSNWSFISIFEWTSEVIFISIEANNNVSTCQRETFILILIHPHPCQSFPSRWSSTVAWMTCSCWCGGAEVSNADPETISPLCLAEIGVMTALIMIVIILSKGWLSLRGTPRIPNHRPKPPINH